MFKKSLLAVATLGLLASEVQAFEFDKPIEVPVTVTKSTPGFTANVSKQNVTIMRVKLSEVEKAAIANRKTSKTLPWRTSAAEILPTEVNLGMSNVPVLDQGRHGSCVTFATSAAIDAVLGKADYVSPLCSLELGTHLEKNGYTYAGWEGSYGPVVLEQMMRFGIVNKTNQESKSCAGVSEYPLKNAKDIGNEMTLTEFKSLSENLNKELYWSHLYSNDQLFDWKTASPYTMQNVLWNVKQQLANGHRVTFGTFLIIPDTGCDVGACATHNAKNDTWALTDGLDTPPYEVGGHEMVIFGYDDNAIARETNGREHKGLLFLRNSWSDKHGDNGNYYMTYDYFIKYANEAQAIIPMK